MEKDRTGGSTVVLRDKVGATDGAVKRPASSTTSRSIERQEIQYPRLQLNNNSSHTTHGKQHSGKIGTTDGTATFW